LAPERVLREGIRDFYIGLSQSYAGRVYLAPEPTDASRPVERLILRLYPGLMTSQAQSFYREVEQFQFLALSTQGWTVEPSLVLRLQATIKCAPTIQAAALPYSSFWHSHLDMIRGNVEREVVAGEYWNAWAAGGLVSDEDRTAVLATFSERQRVHVCPGWSLERSWSLPEAIRLDGQRRAALSFPTSLVTAIYEALTQALSAMGQQALAASPGNVSTPTA